MKVIYDRCEKDVDFSPLYKLEGPVLRNQVKKGLKRFVDESEKGKYCVVTEMHVNGNSRYKTNSLFQIGKQGIIVNRQEERTLIGIEVQDMKNTASDALERLVYKYGSFREFSNNMSQISISSRGISHMEFYNEGTFSPAGGTYITHSIGSYIDSITIGQNRIKKELSEHVKEFELRKISIPFILPSEYTNQIFNGLRFGNLCDVACFEAINVFTKQGYLNDLKYPYDRNKCPYEYRTPQHKRFFTIRNKKIKEYEEDRKQKRKLLEILSSEIKYNMIKNRVLTGIEKCMTERFDFYKEVEGFKAVEINSPYEYDNEGKMQKMPKRGFRLIPSRLIPQQIYSIPDDERSTSYLIESLTRFNSKYPDTVHIPTALENYFPASVIN